MATFDLWNDLIEPVGLAIQADQRFGGLKTIYYDRTTDRAMPRELMPGLNYFLEPGWQDINRGSGSFSLNSRRMTVRLGFAIWCYNSNSQVDLDKELFSISGDLFDFFRENVDFNQSKGIALNTSVPIGFDVDYQGDENAFVGTQKLSVSFELFGGSGK